MDHCHIYNVKDTYRGGGLNLYAYCGNNPLRYYDPSGHEMQEYSDDSVVESGHSRVEQVDGEFVNAGNGGLNFEGGTDVLPNAEELKMSHTVQNHMNDIIKKRPNAGQLSRPYIDSDGTTLLLKEIMESTSPVPDAVLQSGLRWDVSGTFRGSTGTWELVVDTSTNTVVHFNFVSQ